MLMLGGYSQISALGHLLVGVGIIERREKEGPPQSTRGGKPTEVSVDRHQVAAGLAETPVAGL